MGFEIFRSSCKCFFSDKDFGSSSYYSFLIPDEISPKRNSENQGCHKIHCNNSHTGINAVI